jgi:hypothetical protein
MKRNLEISPDLSLPPDAVTQTLVVYGGKGMGKSNFGSVLAEELAYTGKKFSIIDPLGVMWGIRHSANGRGKGVGCLLLGGKRGDIPIHPNSGKIVADLVADEATSTLIDISRKEDGSMWSMAERIRFVADYCERLFQRQGEKRRPVMQIIDEAGRFCPQTIPHGSPDVARCVGAIENLVEWGRNVGVGVTLITQRSARMNKSVSELADSMFAFRTVGPRSIAAVTDWFEDHVDKNRQRDLVNELRSLPVGSAELVSPGWLKFEGRIKLRLRDTFDSSRTPKAGERSRRISKGAKPDLKKYLAKMKEVIEEAEENNPAKLRRQIAELSRELAKRPKEIETRRVEVKVPFIKPRDLRRMEKIAIEYSDIAERLTRSTASTAGTAASLKAAVLEMKNAVPSHVPEYTKQALRLSPTTGTINTNKTFLVQADVAATRFKKGMTGGTDKKSPAQRFLNALAWWDDLGVHEPTRAQLGLVAGIDASGGYFDNVAAPLVKEGLIERGKGTTKMLKAGWERVTERPSIASMEDYHNTIREKLCWPGVRMFDALVAGGKDRTWTRGELGEACGVDPKGGYFDNVISPISGMKLVTRTSGRVTPTDLMFPKQLR